jgi:hypothetical protein
MFYRFEEAGKKKGWRTQVITAAKNPVQMDAVAARAPCRDEKKVPTRAGSAEPVKIPVIFYEVKIVSILFQLVMFTDENSRR